MFQKVSIEKIEARSDQPRRVDERFLADEDSIRVDEDELSVRFKLAEKIASGRADDAVEDAGSWRVLFEVDCFGRVDGERIPLDDRTPAALTRTALRFNSCPRLRAASPALT